MPASLLEQRKLDVEAQFAALPIELETWRKESEEGKPYEKHHSQIAALSAQMLDLNEKIKSGWLMGKSPESFEDLSIASLRCAAIQTVWSYFREKLVLRSHPDFGKFLRAADAYAWACYEPVLEEFRTKNAEHAFREPPLVAFHTEISPWALSRQSRYETDPDAAGMAGRGPDNPFELVRQALPIPILAVPWHYLRFLPNLALLAHETGHVVESDFGLATTMESEIASAVTNAEHREGWSRCWRREVFADLFACFVAGPSFVWALADGMLESPEMVAKKKRPGPDIDEDSTRRWGKYPPGSLRMGLNIRALEKLGFNDEAAASWSYWRSAYPLDAMEDWGQDADAVIDAVYRCGLPDSIRFSRLNQGVATAFRFAAAGNKIDPRREINPRASAAAACLIHRGGNGRLGPILAKPGDSWQILLDHIADSRPPGTLAARVTRAKTFAPNRTNELVGLLFGSGAAVDFL